MGARALETAKDQAKTMDPAFATPVDDVKAGDEDAGFDTPAGTQGSHRASGQIQRWLDRRLEELGATRAGRKVYRKLMGCDTVILTTIGRKSGTERSTPVGGFPCEDGSWLIVAAAGGTARNPAWYYNIAACPARIRIEIEGHDVAVTARQLHGAERAEAWQRITAAAPQFARFQGKTDRELPVLRLMPLSGSRAPAFVARARRGVFATGMEYLTLGNGPRTLLFLQGGPGSAIPAGIELSMTRRLFDPYVRAGYAVWVVTRRRHMPPGCTIGDMADDVAQVIATELGGRVDLLVAESFGGMIAQYLAALHPGCVGRVALVVTGAELSDWSKEADARLAAALARGDKAGAGTVLAEELLPREHMGLVRKAIAPVVGRVIGRRVLAERSCPPEDVLIEVQAGLAFDSRAVLPRIQAPVLLICGDRDQFFPANVLSETARLIPDCSLIWYKGQGHVRAAANRRVADDVLAFASRSLQTTAPGCAPSVPAE